MANLAGGFCWALCRGFSMNSIHQQKSQSEDWPKCLISMVGAAGFELATPCTPCKCATRLRYAPTSARVYQRVLKVLQCRCPEFCPASSGISACTISSSTSQNSGAPQSSQYSGGNTLSACWMRVIPLSRSTEMICCSGDDGALATAR